MDPGDLDRPARVATSAGEHQADLVVAADGIGSPIRAALFPDHPGPRYSGFTAWRFVAPEDGARKVEPAETWGRGAVFGTFQLAGGQVYCYASRVAILGDAAHAMTPHLGQGACQAIEDAVVLAAVAPDLPAYTQARMRRTRMVVTGSYRASRLTGMTSRTAIAVRNTAIRSTPSRLMIRQLDRIAGWTPPA